jgi:uncharacterized protein (TIGR03435 family)
MPGVACHSFNGGMGRGLHGQAVDMKDIAAFVENWTDQPVIDKSDVKGLYQIKTDGWTPMRMTPPGRTDNPNPTTENLNDTYRPTLFSIFKQIGLNLEPQKLPADIYVIENVERPSAN